jgi:hypothetical protein
MCPNKITSDQTALPFASALESRCQHLAALQTSLDHRVGPALSLAADRTRATPLDELLRRADADDLAPVLAEALERIAVACAEHFPGNLFADLDYLCADLVRRGQRSGPGALSACAERIAELQSLFGRHSPIRFRYVHDFLYGFDWARWVKKAPDQRRHVSPFDPEFLAYLEKRGRQLLELIHRDDTKYPSLPPDRMRNPFGFSRHPSFEKALHLDLAHADLIPIRAWHPQGLCRWEADFSQKRQRQARILEKQKINTGPDAQISAVIPPLPGRGQREVDVKDKTGENLKFPPKP